VKFSFLNSIASDAKIGRDLLEQLMDSLETSLIVKEKAKFAKVEFLSDVPMNLRKAAIQNIHNNVANRVALFKDRDPNILSRTIPKMTPLQVKKGKTVWVRGQFASHVYILFSGRVVLINHQGTQLKEFLEGAYFGDYEIFLKIPRQLTMKAMEDSDLMMIERADFVDILQNYPDLKRDVLKTAIVREMQIKMTLAKVKST